MRRLRSGFTMVEVVVAIALLGIGIAAAVACIGSATRASSAAQDLTAVQLMAREKLAELEARGPAASEEQGDFGPDREGYAWRLSRAPSGIPGLTRVRLTILWGDPARPRRADFDTYLRE